MALNPNLKIANIPLTHSFGATETDAAPTIDAATGLAPGANVAPPQGPSGFWGRITQVGKAKTILASAAQNTGKAANATGRFLLQGTAKLANQGYQEGKQVVDTTKMIVASKTKNPEAYKKASEQSQKDYQGFNKNKGGIFNAGTATSAEEAKRGDVKSGVKGIGGATLEAAGELIPLAKFAEGAKVYKLGRGVVEASHSTMRQIAENTVIGLLSGAAGNTGAELLQNGKISWKSTAKGAAAGAILGGGTTAIAKGIGALAPIFRRGPVDALDKLATKDVMTAGEADKVAAVAYTKIGVQDVGSAAEKVGVKTPTRPGIKEISQTDKVAVKTPVRISDQEYTKQFNKISKNYDKFYRELENLSPVEQKVKARSIDNQSQKALEDLNKARTEGVVPTTPSKVTKLTSETSKAEKVTGGAAKEGVNVKSTIQSKVTGNPGKTETAIAPKVTREASAPVTGEKVSGSALKSEQRAVEANLAKEFEGKATYDTASYKTNSESAVKLTHEDPQKAMDIAMGRTPGNNTVHEVAIAKALENKAIQEGDAETLRQLAASSRHTATSEAAQRLGAEGFTNESSPVKLMKQVADTKVTAFETKAKTTVAAAIKKDVATATAHIKVPSKDEWKVFVESLKC